MSKRLSKRHSRPEPELTASPLNSSLLIPSQKHSDSGGDHDGGGGPAERVDESAVGALAHDLSVVRDEHDEYEERRREQAVDDRRPEERGDGGDADEVDRPAAERRGGEDGVELC